MFFAWLPLGPLPWGLGSFGPSQGAFWLSLGPSGSHGTELFLVVLLGPNSHTQILQNGLVEQCNTAFDNCHQKHKLIMRDTKTSSVSNTKIQKTCFGQCNTKLEKCCSTKEPEKLYRSSADSMPPPYSHPKMTMLSK